MTTIIVDRKKKLMAADRLHVTGDQMFVGSPKIRRFKTDHTEWLVASSGCAEAGSFFDLWFESGLFPEGVNDEEREALYPKDGEFNAVALNNRGDLFWYGSKGASIPIKSPLFGLGSGSGYALGAYRAVQDPKRAILIASSFDPYTGKGVQIERIK